MTLNPTPGAGYIPGREGVHRVVAQALDPSYKMLGSSAPVFYTLLRIPPVLTFSPLAAGINNPAISVSGTINAAAFQLPVSILDNGIALKQVSAASDGRWNASLTLSGYGTHTLSAAATDAAGNRGESPKVVTVLSGTAPVLSIISATVATGNAFLVQGRIDALDNSRQITIFDGATEIATVLPQNVHTDLWLVYVLLGPGQHSLTARATNAAGTGVSAPIAVTGS